LIKVPARWLTPHTDFSQVLQDPYDLQYLNPAYNSGDSLHPGDIGYGAMADAIPLGDLTLPR
jgi:hypothetical protein